MGRTTSSSNPPKPRKRVDADPAETNTLKRAKDGSAFTRCEACNKDVPVVLIDMHSCSLDASIKMKFESQIEERVVEVKKPAERKRATSSSQKERKPKKEKKEKDPNKPKRSPGPFFLFMDDFRKTFKEENPDDAKDVRRISKEGGEKWKSMTDEEKKPYIDRAAELKEEYKKLMEKDINGNPTMKESEAEGDGDGGECLEDEE